MRVTDDQLILNMLRRLRFLGSGAQDRLGLDPETNDTGDPLRSGQAPSMTGSASPGVLAGPPPAPASGGAEAPQEASGPAGQAFATEKPASHLDPMTTLTASPAPTERIGLSPDALQTTPFMPFQTMSIRTSEPVTVVSQPPAASPSGTPTSTPGTGTGPDTPPVTGSESTSPLSAASAPTASLGSTPSASQTLTDATGPATLAAPSSTSNAIVLENQKRGNPESEWGLKNGVGDNNIQGFATDISVNHGTTIDFKIATDSTKYRLDIYRIGYYGGAGARKVDSIEKNLTTAQVQPHPIVDYSTGLIDCGNWNVSASWQVPADAVSGVYFAKLVREDGTPGENMIPFIVRNDQDKSDITFQTSDTTWQAYNAWGGASLYYGDVPLNPEDMISYVPPNCSCGLTAIGRAYKVSYNRPFITDSSPRGGPWDFIFGAEYPAIRWLEQNGYDINYISGVDTARDGAQLLNSKAFLSVGHDEYWSAEQRANVEAARDAGVNLAFWSGNEAYWKIRWENSIDGNGTPYRTLVTYKESLAHADIDPSSTGTGTWRDPRFADPGQEPENSLTGTMFMVDSYRKDTITIPYEMSKLRFWRNTDIANLQPGQTGSLVQNLLGYEWDSDVDNGFRPAGLINMSLSTVNVNTLLQDYGSTVGPGTATHSLTLYRAESGALVFGAGTVYWSWGLDDQNSVEATPVDPNVQQAMVNLFADMGIQPQTLQASLVLASASTDHTAPTASLTFPNGTSNIYEGQKITISGTAADVGGVVAGVEVSTDGGQSWHKATGRNTWTYTWNTQDSGTYQVLARAVDDSLNLGTPTAPVNISVKPALTDSFFNFADTPSTLFNIDARSVELGMKFTSSTAGKITGIRFYKPAQILGDRVAHLWTGDGTLLATATFDDMSYSGWQTATFETPITIAPGTTYVASYHTRYYSSTSNYFTTPITAGPLTAPIGASVFAYGDGTLFPNSNGGNANYWVDVIFDAGPQQPPVANADSGFTTARNNVLTIPAASLLGNDTDPNGDTLTITGVSNAAHGSVTYNAQNKTVTFTPTTDYTGAASFTYTISDGRGGTASANVSLSVVDQSALPVSLFSPSVTPTNTSSTDSKSVELGMKFQASVSGTVSGVKFYKGTGDTGTHEGRLWTSTGTLLGTVTFANESASGWQTAYFSNPIALNQNETYVVSYHSNGHYASTPNYFTAPVTNGPLTAPAGNNGVFAYGTSAQFPTNSYGSANYFVDVLFNATPTANQPPVANADSGFTTTRDNALTLAATSLLSNDTDPNGDTLTITGVGNATHGSVAYNAQNKTVTFTPTAGYMGAASFTYTISDGRGGTASANVSLSVLDSGSAPISVLPSSLTPNVASNNDSNSVELGMKFQASVSGTVSGVKFYKGTGDTGSHEGRLWTSTGTLLGTVTFSNESASGWQTAYFSNPIALNANETYVVSYHSNGHYASTSGYFTAPVTNGPLTAPAGNNGVFAYGTSALFPTNSYGSANYFVDVLFNPTPTANQPPVANADSGFTTARNNVLTIQAASLLGNDTDPNGDTLTITGVSNPAHGSVVYNAQNKTVSFTPTTDYTGAASFTYTISDGQGGTASANVSLSVLAPTSMPVSLFSPSTTPETTSSFDSKPVELGMRFQSSAAGTVSGVKFYKGTSDTGTHEGRLWTSTGTLLGTVAFSNESASGWQTAYFSNPVTINPNETYVVSYHSNGHYAATSNGFASAVTNGPLTASAGNNGVYAYGSTSLFPTSSYNATNYFVDVVFNPLTA